MGEFQMNSLFTLFIPFHWLDLIDILLVAAIIYQLYHLVKGTVAIRIFIGILSIYIFWKVVDALQMELLTEILRQVIGVGMIALIIVFQQEIRRFLILIGTTGFRNIPLAKRLFNWGKNQKMRIEIGPLIKACESMTASKTGALIVIQRETDLDFHLTIGDKIDGKITSRLLESIFYKNSPLHDGAVVIAENRIKYSRCILPVTNRENFPNHLGMRHRSAAGIAEHTDCIAIVLSEQTGNISIAEGNRLWSLSIDGLKSYLENKFTQ